MQPSLFEVIARAVIVVLVNGLWQGVAIAALTWLALRLFPRVNASTRYAAWTLALVAVVDRADRNVAPAHQLLHAARDKRRYPVHG